MSMVWHKCNIKQININKYVREMNNERLRFMQAILQ